MSQQQQQTQACSSSRQAPPVEPEQCLILRPAQPAADKLRGGHRVGAQLQDPAKPGGPAGSAQLHSNLRRRDPARRRWLTCPGIVEGLKTADSRTSYRRFNDPRVVAAADRLSASATVTATAEERMHQWDHGLTPPLRNVAAGGVVGCCAFAVWTCGAEKEVKTAAEKTIWKRQMSKCSLEEEASKTGLASSQQQQQFAAFGAARRLIAKLWDDGSNTI
uniref:Uncharacterized protein n=1 Tax=Macrostomum lignano TaxID=282301 RepID=A0A1I8FAL4_9PLAT